jgi:hypothetical protein
VSHHAGPERGDSLAVLRDLDRQISRIERSFAWAPRPYRIVVLSDHGQTQGATFRQRYGETLSELVGRLCGGASSGDDDAEEGNTESTAWFRSARGHEREQEQSAEGPTVLASGNLGLVYLPVERHRLHLEEIEGHYPGLVDGLIEHEGVGFVLARSRERGAVVLGRSGSHELDSGRVVGVDPLQPFGPGAVEMVHRVCDYPNLGDLMVNSMFDPALDEVAAFEEQVGSHGGLGGAQTHPFVLYPSDLPAPDGPIEGPVALHGVLKGWLADLGQPVARVEPKAPARAPATVSR